MTLKSNPVTTLSAEQTSELRGLWNMVGNMAEPSKDRLVKLKLSRNCAFLTKRQLYMIAVTMALAGIIPIPDWLHDILDAKHE